MPIYVEKATRKGITEEAALALKGQGKVLVYPDDVDPALIKKDLDAWTQEREELALENRDGAMSRGIAQGVSAGFSDELAGGIAGGIEAGRALFTDKPVVETFKEVYKDVRDSERDKLDKDRDLNPNTATASNIVGAVIPSPALAAKGAQGLKALTAKSAAVGAAQGAGYSEATNTTDLVKDTAVGASVGAVAPVVIKGAGAAIKGANKATKASSEGLEKTGDNLLKSKLKTEVRRNVTKIDDEIKVLKGAKEELLNRQAVLKTDVKVNPKLKKDLTQVDNKLKSLDIDIKAKERAILKEQGKLNPDIEKTQSKLDDATGLDEVVDPSYTPDMKQKLKIDLEKALNAATEVGKKVSKANTVVDMAAPVIAGIVTGNAPLAIVGTLAKKGVIDKLLKKQGIEINLGEIGIDVINTLKSTLGKTSKLSAKAINNISTGLSKLEIPQKYASKFEMAQTPAAVAGIHYLLLTQDPKYREEMKKLTDNQGKTLMFNDKPKGNK